MQYLLLTKNIDGGLIQNREQGQQVHRKEAKCRKRYFVFRLVGENLCHISAVVPSIYNTFTYVAPHKCLDLLLNALGFSQQAFIYRQILHSANA